MLLCILRGGPDLFVTIQENGVGVHGVHAFGTTHRKFPAISTGKGSVQGQPDCLAAGAGKYCGDDIALLFGGEE